MKTFTFLYIILLFCLNACVSEGSRLKNEWKENIQFYNENQAISQALIDPFKKVKLLDSATTGEVMDERLLSSDLKDQLGALGIQEIRYGRYITCDAMQDYAGELFLHLSERVAFWYAPCIEQSNKDHLHKNNKLRGYEDEASFHSVGLGGSWAIVEIQEE